MSKDIIKMVIGNKSDREETRQVPTEQAAVYPFHVFLKFYNRTFANKKIYCLKRQVQNLEAKSIKHSLNSPKS
jgi:hypothetical protein